MDVVGDMLTRLRNAGLVNKSEVEVRHSNYIVSILEVLQKEGYITSFNVFDVRKNIKSILVCLKYYNSSSVIKDMGRISKLGRRVYCASKNLPKIYNGLGIAVVSTSKGIMSDKEARIANIGGELLCYVF